MSFYKNKYAGKCKTCGQRVEADAGFVRKESGGYKAYHNSDRCLPSEGVKAINNSNRRELTAKGQIFCPYERDNLGLLRAMPGARWNPEDKCWTVSLEARDRTRVLEVADQLKLEVAATLRTVKKPKFVKDVVASAKAAGAYDFQLKGIEFLALSDGSRLLGDDMGLGKTIQTLLAIPKGSRVLAVVPACVKCNWADETARWRKDLSPVILQGRKAFRFPKKNEIVIVNPEGLPLWMNKAKEGEKYFTPEWTPAQIKAAKGILVVADEAHMYKNFKAARSQRMTALVQYSKKAYALTGTPLVNNPLNLWGVLSTFQLQWDVFGGWNRFISLFGGSKGRFGGWDWESPSPEVAERLRRVMLRRLKTEVMTDLPAKTRQTVRVDIPASLKRALDKLWEDQGENKIIEKIRSGVYADPTTAEDWLELLALARGHVTAEEYLREYGCPYTYEEASLLVKSEIRDAIQEQISKGCLPSFKELSKVRALLAKSRIKATAELVSSYEDSETPVVVFSAHREPVEALGAREGWAAITGSVKATERRQIVADFQAGKYKGIALTIGAGGVGITLTKAATMIFVDRAWTPAENLQAEDRIHRIGQTANCHYINLESSHPLDRRVNELLTWKMHIIENAIDGKIEAVIPAASKGPQVIEESQEAFDARVATTQATIARAQMGAEERALDVYNSSTRSRLGDWTTRYSEKSGRKVKARIGKRRAARLREAFAFLSGQCDGANTEDGVGFNKPDAAIARRLDTLGLEEDLVSRLLDVMLFKYHRTQLAGQFSDLY